MKKNLQWLATALCVAGGLMIAGSASAQGITGTTYLSNIDPSQASFTGVWNVSPPTTITSTATGLEINSVGGTGTFSTMYYYIPPSQEAANNPNATQVVFNYTWNSGDAVAGVNVLFALDDSLGGSEYYGTGYVIPSPGLNSFTFNLQSANLADIQAGAVINGMNLQIDPANVNGTYDITFNSLTLSPVPEPTTLALAGLGLASLLVLRRRNK
jgi:hypothetical protein